MVFPTVRSKANFYVYTSTKSYNLILYQLQDHNIQRWRKVLFALAKGGQQALRVQEILFLDYMN